MRIFDLRRYRRHLARELDNASLYRALAVSAEGEHREVFQKSVDLALRAIFYTVFSTPLPGTERREKT